MMYFLGSLPALIIFGIVAWLVIPVVRLHFASKRRLRRMTELREIFENPSTTHEEAVAALRELADLRRQIGKC